MEMIYPYLVAYLAGFATPFLALRGLISNKAHDGSGCLLNFCIVGVGAFILLVIYYWVMAS